MEHACANYRAVQYITITALRTLCSLEEKMTHAWPSDDRLRKNCSLLNDQLRHQEIICFMKSKIAYWH